MCGFSLFVKAITLCLPSSLSPPPPLSLSLPLFLYLFLLLSVTQEFSRVSSFCPTCLPSGTQEVQHRNPDIRPVKLFFVGKKKKRNNRSAAYLCFRFFSLALLCFHLPRGLLAELPRLASLTLSRFTPNRFIDFFAIFKQKCTILVSGT